MRGNNMALRRIVAALHQQTKPSAEAYEAAIDEAASGDEFSMALRLVGLAVGHGYALRMTNTATPHVVRAHCDCMAALRATTAVLRRSSAAARSCGSPDALIDAILQPAGDCSAQVLVDNAATATSALRQLSEVYPLFAMLTPASLRSAARLILSGYGCAVGEARALCNVAAEALFERSANPVVVVLGLDTMAQVRSANDDLCREFSLFADGLPVEHGGRDLAGGVSDCAFEMCNRRVFWVPGASDDD